MSVDNTVTAGYRALNEGAGVYVLRERAHVDASDRHRARFLHNMTTCDVNGLSAGQGTFGLTVDRGGKLVGQLFLDVGADVIRIEVDAALREAIVAHWLKHRVADMIRFEEVDGLAVIALVGPKAAGILDGLSDGAASGLAPNQWIDGVVGGVTCRIRHNEDRLAQVGYDLTVDEGQVPTLVRALCEGGALEVSEAVWDCARVSRGVPNRVDMNEENIPLESDHLVRGISWDKGCYIGQEVIARMHFRGNPNRYLRGLRIAGDAPQPGETLHTEEGKEAGVVGTVSLDAASGATIALDVVKRRFAEEGATLSTQSGATAQVVNLPFSTVAGAN